MAECWASGLGSCSDKISREHIVSESLFTNDIVRVEGFSWCKDKEKEIGLRSLTAKILCKKHNAALSPVDIGGASAFEAFRNMTKIGNVRKKVQPQIWDVIQYSIDGILLERWFLKTLINISFGGEYPIGETP